MSKGYKNLDVWNDAYELSLIIYNQTKSYPKEEIYDITKQLRNASTSIVANIAEGYGRNSIKDYIRFVSISIGSCNELEVFLMLSNDLDYISDEKFNELIKRQPKISKMLHGLRIALERKNDAKSH